MSKHAVSEYMTPSPHTVGSAQPLTVAHQIMRDHRIRHLPVLEGGKLVGVISLRDLHLIETLADVDPDKVAVEEAMTSDVFTAAPTMPVGEVTAEMADHKYGSAVVVEHGKVVGVFTTTDALRVTSELLKAAERET